MSNNRKKRRAQTKKTHRYNRNSKPKKPVKAVVKATFFKKIKQSKPMIALKKFIETINLEKLKEQVKKIDFSKIISFKKIKDKSSFNEIVSQTKIHMKNFKKEIIFFTGMTVVIACLFVVIRLPGSTQDARAPEEMLSLDLSAVNNSMLMNVEAEVAQVTKKDSDSNTADKGVVLNLTSMPEDNAALTILNKTDQNLTSNDFATNNLVAPPVNIITPNSVNGIYDNHTQVAGQNIPGSEKLMSVSNTMMLGVMSYAILVDEKPVAFFEEELEANNFLEALREEFKDPEAVEERVIFKENIRVEKYKNDILDFQGYQDFDTVMEYIRKGTNEQKIHTVQEGENFWVIAERNNMNPYDLIDANPDIDENRLQIGTELSLIVAEPIINVLNISTVERTDEIPYGRGDNVPTDQYFVGRSVTKVSGVPGEAKNTIEVYTENGKILGERILSSDIIRQPVDMVSYVGTKPAPPAIGTGTFSNPTSRGYVTSNFGSRSLGWHTGIDIGLSMRNNVLAADGGVVIFAGYKGTYGKLIIIDHGANKTTYYAHNDQWLVSAGEKVFKGQPIALSGNTGRSTGPHLHFEVRINNQPVNPRKYVNY